MEPNYVETEEEILLMAYTNMNKANEEAVWFLDSGCSNHMRGKKEYFSNLDESYKDYVKLGNNSSMIWTLEFSGFKYASTEEYGKWLAKNGGTNKTVQGLLGREATTRFIPKEEYLEGHTSSATNTC
ncbi:hypothetical protein CR513_27716, partial [Mucuna pruriens]